MKAEDWVYDDDKLMLLECLARDGYTKQMLADRMGIAPKTLIYWESKYPQLKEAIKKGAEIIDYKVENALLKAALGYKTEEVKTFISGESDAQGNRQVRLEKITKEVPPNVTAIAIWLNNRKPNQWKRNRDNVLEMNDEDSKITVNIIRHGKNGTDADAPIASPDDEVWDVDKIDTSKEEKGQKNAQSRSKEKAKQQPSKQAQIIKGSNEDIDDMSDEEWLNGNM